MAGLVLAPGETNISRIAQITRQLMGGKSNATGIATLNFGNGEILSLGAFTPGASYAPGFYASLALTGGTGAGANADITVNGGGAVSVVVLSSGGTGYSSGDVLSAAIPGAGFGPISSITLIGGGFGYVNGTYLNRPFTGGSGGGATGDFTVVGNTITAVALNQPGANYAAGDTLTVNPGVVGGAGGGFFAQVNGVTGAGFTVHAAAVSGGSRTVVPAPNCSTTSIVLFSPMTAHAAALMTGIYVKQVDIEKGQFAFTHPNTPNGDCTFMWESRG